MVKLSPEQIGALIFRGTMPSTQSLSKAEAVKFLDTAVAIVLAESGGETTAANPTSNARGLWQIMTTAHEDKIAKSIKYWQEKDTTTPDEAITILDPRVNTSVALAVRNEAKGWTPWEVYNTGSYKQYLGHGARVYVALSDKKRVEELWVSATKSAVPGGLGGVLGVGPGDVAGGVTGFVTDIPGAISGAVSNVLKFFKDAGIVVGVFLLGAILILLGMWAFLSQSKTVKSAVKTGSNVIPMGKVAKAAKGAVK